MRVYLAILYCSSQLSIAVFARSAGFIFIFTSEIFLLPDVYRHNRFNNNLIKKVIGGLYSYFHIVAEDMFYDYDGSAIINR